jgi:hypothetical protein
LPWTDFYQRTSAPAHCGDLLDSTPPLVAALLAETGGTTHSIMQALNSAAIVAIHEGIEHITPELLTVQRTDPARLLRAKLSTRVTAAVAVNDESEQPTEVAA